MRKLRLQAVRLFMPASLVLALPLISQASGPDPGQPFIESISYGGSGCPQNTVAQSISDDRQSFTLVFDVFVAAIGLSVPVTEQTKNCTITLHLHLAPGWQTWTQATARRGYVQLDSGIQAFSRATHTMNAVSAADQTTGNGVDQSSQSNFSGPVAKRLSGGGRLFHQLRMRPIPATRFLRPSVI